MTPISDDKAGTRFIKFARLEEGPHRHPPFDDEEVRRLIRGIQKTLAEVEPATLEQWEDDFRRDNRPEREIATWLHIAAVYSYFTKPRGRARTLSPKEKADVFKICLTCSINGALELQAASDKFSRAQRRAEAITKLYFEKRLVSDDDLAVLQRYFNRLPYDP